MKPRILVVDDDRAMVRTLCDILRMRGWEAVPAHSGEEAIETTQRADDYACVLMDIKMPGIDGISALKVMKSAAPDLRVILMSAYTTDDDIQQALGHGVWRVIPKPIDLPALFAMLAA